MRHKQDFTQGCQLSGIEHESHAQTLFLMLSRQPCKIFCMNANHPAKHITFFFFCLSLFLKVKTETQFDGWRRKKNCKILEYYFSFSCFGFGSSHQAILQKLTALLYLIMQLS